MLYKTHVAVTYAATFSLLVSTDSLSVGNVVALGIGSIFPDIDHPKSYIGNRMKGISHGMKMAFGHRGLAHSLVGAIFFLWVCRFLLDFFQMPYEWGNWFSIGYIAHMIEDSFSKTGIAWLQPVYNKRIQFGLKKIYYTTGQLSETIIFIGACIGLIYQLTQLMFGQS